MSMVRDIGALAWAKNWGGNSIINLLNKGDKFTFCHSQDKVMTYCGRGWYQDESGHKFRTGMRVAVKKI